MQAGSLCEGHTTHTLVLFTLVQEGTGAETALVRAARKDNLQDVNILLVAGADPDTPAEVEHLSAQSHSLLSLPQAVQAATSFEPSDAESIMPGAGREHSNLRGGGGGA